MKSRQLFPMLLLCLVFFNTGRVAAQTLDSTNLPIIILDTYGQVIPDDPRIIVFMGIIDNGYGNMNHVTDSFTNYAGEVSIEIRGSTSQQYPKKAYAFSPVDSLGASVNFDIMGLPSENDWILYAPYPDKTMMRNTLAFYLANRMGHYSSRTRFAEVVRNGSYRGVYELQEKIKRDNNRVDIAKLTPADTSGDDLTGGYIIKIDKTTGSGTATFVSAFDPDVIFQYHDPEDTELLPVQKNYIINYVDSFETALLAPWFTSPDSGYRKYADVNSFIDFFLLQELGHTVDGYRSSCFLHKDKDSNGGKLTMGPMWDFNLSFGNADYCDAYDTTGWQYQFNFVCTGYSPHVPFWWGRLLQDINYRDSLRCRWMDLRASFLHTDSINAWIDSVANYLDDAQQRNFIKWPILGVYVNWNYYIGQTYQDEVDYLKMWIEKRSEWLDNNLPGNCIGTGLADNPNPLGINVAPNPSAGQFKMTFAGAVQNGMVEIVNSVGKKVFTAQLNDQSELSVNLDNVTGGIYFVNVDDGHLRYFTKISIVDK